MVVTLAVAPRRSDGWIDSFVNATSHFPSPKILRTWAAISAIGAALERKVWVRTGVGELYPNLYVVLVSPAGVGKGEAIRTMRRLTVEAKDLKVSPSSITTAALIDCLNRAERKVLDLRKGEYCTFNSLYVISTELGVLIPKWDSTFMNTLTDIYDGVPYAEERRTAKLQIAIKSPQINLLAGTTPSYLNEILPPGAWDQGFVSRAMLIYSGIRDTKDIFIESTEEFTDLIYDYKAISALQGKMTWEPAARDLIRDWHLAGGPPVPTHTKLINYITRRTAHMIKLCIIACASRASDLVINATDVGMAFNWLFEAEEAMPDIFLSLSSGGDSRAIEDAYAFLWNEYAKRRDVVPEYMLAQFLRNRVPSHNVMRVIDVMLRSRAIELVAGKDGAAYKPLKL